MSLDIRVRDLATRIATELKLIRVELADAGGGGGVPLVVDAPYTAQANTQQVYAVSPRIDSLLVVDGLLMEVN